GAEDDLRAARGWNQPPALESALRGFDRGIDVAFAGLLENRDYFARVGGITVFECFSSRGCHPLAVNEVLQNFGIAASHQFRAGYSLGRHNCLLINTPNHHATGPSWEWAREGAGGRL